MPAGVRGRQGQRSLLLDAASEDELLRRWRDQGGRGNWAPSPEERTVDLGRRPAASYLAPAMLPLGLLAIAALATGVLAAVDARGQVGPMQWLRLALLATASVIVVGQGWALFAGTSVGRAASDRLEVVRARIRPASAWQPPPLLDRVPLAQLRRAADSDLGDAAPWDALRRRARRSTAGASWWSLVALSLLLSAGIAGLMAAVTAREVLDGRALGSWVLLPAGAMLVAIVGFALTIRTAVLSVRDRRRRRRGRLFRRVVGGVARGSPATGTPGASGTAGASTIGAATRLPGPFQAAASRITRGRAAGEGIGAPSAVAAGASLPSSESATGDDVSAGDGGGGGGSGPTNDLETGEVGPDPIGNGHFGAFAAASVAALFLGLLPWPGGAGGFDEVDALTPHPLPVEEATVAPLTPIGGAEDLAPVWPSPEPTIGGFTVPEGSGVGTPVAGEDGLADPGSPPDAPPPAPAPSIAPPAPTAPPAPPTASPTPSPTPTRTPTPTSTPSPTPSATPSPTPSPTPSATPSPTPTPPDTPPVPPPPDPRDEPPPRDPPCPPGGPSC